MYLIPNYPAGAFIDHCRIPIFKATILLIQENGITILLSCLLQARNLAWKIQQETQEYIMVILIEKAVDMTGEDNIVISGGYGSKCYGKLLSIKKDSLN